MNLFLMCFSEGQRHFHTDSVVTWKLDLWPSLYKQEPFPRVVPPIRERGMRRGLSLPWGYFEQNRRDELFWALPFLGAWSWLPPQEDM